MNSQEAKFILQAYRHTGDDAKDPQFAEALAQAGRDPELAAWVAEDQRLHQRVRRAIQGISVPPDLKANILAGGKIAAPAPRWRQPVWLAAAAAVVLLLVWLPGRMFQGGPGDYETFRDDMSRFLNKEFDHTLDLSTSDLGALQSWLAEAGCPVPGELPSGLASSAGIGCRVLNYHGRKVSLVCFRAQGSVVHLFIIDNPGWTDLPPPERPLVAQSGFWSTAAWTRNNRAYLLASESGEEDLRRIL